MSQLATSLADAPGSARRSIGRHGLDHTAGRLDLRRSAADPHMAAGVRAGRAAGANTFRLKFRARTLDEHLEQFAAFAESVVPPVDET